MDDERSTPQEEHDEVEAHHKNRGPVENAEHRSADEDDDEVVAHHRMRGPVEHKQWHPSE
jgi:hypothetical protein